MKLVEEDLVKLREFEDATLETYTNSLEIRLQVERLLERIVGRVIDINYHILKEKYDYIPTDYYNSFTALGEKGHVNAQFAKEVALSSGLRNALAHEYDDVDDELVFNSIKTCLTQIPHYLKDILTINEKS